jgi:hypothetical protein
MGKPYTVFSDNLKMNTAAFPKQPKGYAQGGIVMGDDMMELMERPPATVTEALVRKAADEAQRREAMQRAKDDSEKRRKKDGGM